MAAGNPAEFTDAKFPAMGHGREVTRVKSTGVATVNLNVMIKVRFKGSTRTP